MKKKMIKNIVVIIFLLLGSVMTSHAKAILWQIGDADNSADEFTNNMPFAGIFNYDFGIVSRDNYTKYDYDTPGYIYTSQYPTVDTFTTSELNIKFTLVDAYDELLLNYGRGGAELDKIYLDGTEVSSLNGNGENIWVDLTVPLFDLAIGEHEIAIQYAGGGFSGNRYIDNGFYLDYVQLENGVLAQNNIPAPTPEPATMLLLGTGLVGLAGFGRKKKKH